MRSFNRLISIMFVMLLSACVSTDLSRRPPELIVEGAEAGYPMFEAAAKTCGYGDYRRFPGATVQGGTSVAPHFNLFNTGSPAAGCAIRWVEVHPEAGLTVGIH